MSHCLAGHHLRAEFAIELNGGKEMEGMNMCDLPVGISSWTEKTLMTAAISILQR